MTQAEFNASVNAEIHRRFVEPFLDPTRATTHFVHRESGEIDGPFQTAAELAAAIKG